jgi:uncharacterized protein (DUF885 family)
VSGPGEPARAAEALVERYWDELLELEPLLGTSVGDERFDDRLPDPSEAGRARAEAVHRAALSEAGAMDRGPLDMEVRTSLDLVEAIARRYLAELEHRTDRLAVASHLWGPGALIGDIASIQRADTPERLERYDARLRALPDHLEACADIAREGIDSGVTSPRIVAERAVAQIERLLELEPRDAPVVVPVRADPPAAERLAGTVRDVVWPAYARYLEVLRDYLPHASDSIGLSALPGGDEMYAAEILAWTSLPLGAREIHDLGVERFEQIQSERREIAATLGYATAEDALGAYRASGADTATSPEQLVELARDQVQRSWDAAPTWFGRLPSTNCEVRPVEAFREADMAAAFYNGPTEDGSRPGVYYINTFDLPSRDLHVIAGITFHEANPGHHFQVAIEQEFHERPRLRRFGGILAGSAFVEGWGLYAERLADEMGLYADEWERLGMLENQNLRAARLITDTGIHALGWDRDRAVAKLEEGGSSHTDAVIEIDRYITMPGQALSYMIGMIEIERARAAAASRPGFVLRDWHDRLLALGTIPLPALARELLDRRDDQG